MHLATGPLCLFCACQALYTHVWHILAPPHSLQVLLMRWCGQMLAPPHSLQWQRIALEHSRDALPQASHACGASRGPSSPSSDSSCRLLYDFGF